MAAAHGPLGLHHRNDSSGGRRLDVICSCTSTCCCRGCRLACCWRPHKPDPAGASAQQLGRRWSGGGGARVMYLVTRVPPLSLLPPPPVDSASLVELGRQSACGGSGTPPKDPVGVMVPGDKRKLTGSC